MKISCYDKDILTTIYNFKYSVQDITFKLYTNTLDEMLIRFPKQVVFNLLGFNNTIKKSDGSYYETLNGIVDAIYKGQTYQIPKNKKNILKSSAEKVKKLVPITLNSIHSIIEDSYNTYLIMISDNGNVILKLVKEKNTNNFMVVDLLDITYLEKLMNNPFTRVSIPIKSEYVKLEDKENRKVRSYMLDDNEVSERLLEMREFIYLHSNNAKYQNYLDYVSMITK